MKKKHIAVIIGAVIVLFVCCIFGANALLTNLIESTNVVCKDQKFSSAEEALQAMEADEGKTNDSSLDYCPPYELLYTSITKRTPLFFIVTATVLMVSKAHRML